MTDHSSSDKPSLPGAEAADGSYSPFHNEVGAQMNFLCPKCPACRTRAERGAVEAEMRRAQAALGAGDDVEREIASSVIALTCPHCQHAYRARIATNPWSIVAFLLLLATDIVLAISIMLFADHLLNLLNHIIATVLLMLVVVAMMIGSVLAAIPVLVRLTPPKRFVPTAQRAMAAGAGTAATQARFEKRVRKQRNYLRWAVWVMPVLFALYLLQALLNANNQLG